MAAVKLKFKARKTSSENTYVPQGEWEALIPKGKCRVSETGNGDPKLIIPFKLLTAAEEANEGHQGAEVPMSVVIFDDVSDPTKQRGANMMKDRLRGLCNAIDVDFGDVYPAEMDPEHKDGFGGCGRLFNAIEGKKLTIWTVHSSRDNNGETITDVEIRFKKPGSGLVTKAAEGGEEDRPAKRAASGGRRR